MLWSIALLIGSALIVYGIADGSTVIVVIGGIILLVGLLQAR